MHGSFPVGQHLSSNARVLTGEEEDKLKKDQKVVSQFKQTKLEQDAQKNWDLFYKRNSTSFFKDRHWTYREFSELSTQNLSRKRHVLFEVGCGCGNTIFPIIEDSKSTYIYACDFSPRAIEFVKSNHLYDPQHCHAFQCDITHDDVTKNIPEHSVDYITLIFVLSAILPQKMIDALKNLQKVLKPGGMILFRDYGLYDHAMLRFSSGHKLQENLYVRQDGTRAFYFSTEYLDQLFSSAGYIVTENIYVHKRTVNKKEGVDVPRVFVQGKYQKRF